jgi:hypothetical protein
MSRLEPWDELSDKSLEKVKTVTDAIHKATDIMEHNLATDTLKVHGQNWACVSFVSPSGNQKCPSIGMKIRGVFDTHPEAVEHVKRLIKLDPVFDIFICDMYNWCLVPPDPEHIADQTYQDQELNKIISEYRKNQIYAKEHFEERKREMVEQAADEAKRAALKAIEENEVVETTEVIQDSDVIECANETESNYAPADQSPDSVSASDIMASMV